MLLHNNSMRFYDYYIWYVCAAVAIPSGTWLKSEHPPQFPAYQTAGRMFYYAVPVRRRNLQFKVFLLLMNNAVNFTTAGPICQGIKYISNLLCACAEGQVFVLGMNQCISQKEMHSAGSEKHSRHLKHGVHFPLQSVYSSACQGCIMFLCTSGGAFTSLNK